MLDKKKFYINGKWIEPNKENIYDVINPSNEEVFATISLKNEAELSLAVEPLLR